MRYRIACVKQNSPQPPASANDARRQHAFLLLTLESDLAHRFQIVFPKQSTITAAGDPAAAHPSFLALAPGQLHARLAKCRSPECRSQRQGWSTAACCQSPGPLARDSYVENLLAETSVPVPQAGRSSVAPPESTSAPAAAALQPPP